MYYTIGERFAPNLYYVAALMLYCISANGNVNDYGTIPAPLPKQAHVMC